MIDRNTQFTTLCSEISHPYLMTRLLRIYKTGLLGFISVHGRKNPRELVVRPWMIGNRSKDTCQKAYTYSTNASNGGIYQMQSVLSFNDRCESMKDQQEPNTLFP